jgi:transcriptional regulator with XRE-family HTH domain
VKPRTAAEEHLARRHADPEYEAAYETASRRIAMFDEVVRSLDIRLKELGLTKAELSRRADLPAAAVRRLFSQQRKNPTLTTLVALADALGMQLRLIPKDDAVRQVADGGGHEDAPNLTEEPSHASGTRRRTA